MCHSGWPFCTRLGLATGLVGRLPSRLLWYPRRGSLTGRLTWIGRLPPLRMRVDTVSYPHACVVSPPEWPYLRRHIGLSQSVRVWQSVSPDSRVAHSPRPSWDFRLGLCLARSPLHRQIRLVLVVHLLVASDQAKASSPGQLSLLIAAAVTLPPTTKVGGTALANWSLI